MLRLAANVYCLATMLALGFFLDHDKASALGGLIASLPHLPARLIRMIGVGHVIDAAMIPASDKLIGAIGYHPWLQGFVLVCVLMGMNATANFSRSIRIRTRFRWAIPLLCLPIGFIFVSAWLAGMHLSRAGSALVGGEHLYPESVLGDLFLGMESVDDSAPQRAIGRLARISPQVAWSIGNTGDEQAKRLAEQALERLHMFVREIMTRPVPAARGKDAALAKQLHLVSNWRGGFKSVGSFHAQPAAEAGILTSPGAH